MKCDEFSFEKSSFLLTLLVEGAPRISKKGSTVKSDLCLGGCKPVKNIQSKSPKTLHRKKKMNNNTVSFQNIQYLGGQRSLPTNLGIPYYP